MRLVDGSWCWDVVGVGVGIGGLSGVRVFGWKGVGNLEIGKVDLLWTPGQRPADFLRSTRIKAQINERRRPDSSSSLPPDLNKYFELEKSMFVETLYLFSCDFPRS